MKKMEIIIRHSRLAAVKDALVALGIHGMTLVEIKGFGRQGGRKETYRGAEFVVDFLPKLKLEVVVDCEMVEPIINAVRQAAGTGNVGDGKIFVYPMDNVVRIRTGERGEEAV